MSDWREREFAHESEAYYRSLDQVSGSPAEACMGGHVEKGKTVTDWFTVEHQGGKVKISFDYGDLWAPEYVTVWVQGIEKPEFLPSTLTQVDLIKAARELAIKMIDAESGDFAQES